MSQEGHRPAAVDDAVVVGEGDIHHGPDDDLSFARNGPFLNRRAMIAEAREALAVFDVSISPTARMGSLPVGLRQIVEIVKAARTGAQVVMLDEPTSAISEREVEGLY